ncbi:25692_t:CDS:2, partial [Dentiscutata erythropus]
YANGGSLRDHLQSKQKDGFYKILWIDLIRIAKEITSGLAHLHDKNIVHRDLHSMNILINNNVALITDFGISKHLDGITNGAASSRAILAYVEPQQCAQSEEKVDEINKKSDIYSLGVLFWELTSGVPPFHNLHSENIAFKIASGVRENIIDNTPLGYAKLIESCWSADPNQRPFLNKVLDELNRLSTETTVEFIINRINSSNKNILANSNISVDEVFSKNMPTSTISEFSERRNIGKAGKKCN